MKLLRRTMITAGVLAAGCGEAKDDQAAPAKLATCKLIELVR